MQIKYNWTLWVFFFFICLNLYFDSSRIVQKEPRKEVKGNWDRASEAVAILSQTLLERESVWLAGKIEISLYINEWMVEELVMLKVTFGVTY